MNPPSRCRAAVAVVLPAVLCPALVCAGASGQTGEPQTLDAVASEPLDAEALDADRVWHLDLLWENDGTYVKRFDASDRHYTNGLKLSLSFTPAAPGPVTGWFAEVLDYSDPRVAIGFAATHRMFTESDIAVAEPTPDDHPWAGHIGFSAFAQLAQENEQGRGGVMDHVEVRAGWVGERAGAAGLQKFVHSAVPDQTRPNGWSNQLTNEITVLARWQRRWRFLEGVFGDETEQQTHPSVNALGGPGAFAWDAIGHLGAAAGNEAVFAETGLTLRAGYNLPRDFGLGRIAEFRDATADGLAQPPLSVYGFVRGNAKAVAHDLFLDGNVLAAGETGVDSREVVGEVTAGLALRWHWFELGYSVTYLTEEFYGQSGGHSYGSLRLGARIPF